MALNPTIPPTGGGLPGAGGGSGGAPAGSPPGPPSSMSPGAGAGKQAAADHAVKRTLQPFYLALGVYEPGSKKHKALVGAIKLLSDAFGAEGGASSGVPGAVLQSARNGVGGAAMPQGPAIPSGLAAGAMSPGGSPPQPAGA